MKAHLNKFSFPYRILILGGMLAALSACEEKVSPEQSLEDFESVFEAGGSIDDFPQNRFLDTLSVDMQEAEDRSTVKDGKTVEERWVCVKRRLSIMDGNSEFPLFNTQADVIYPGNLLQYKSLADAPPRPIVVKRAGGVISYDLNNGNIQSTFRVDSVQKGAIQEAMNTIINSSGKVVPANFNLEIMEVQSREQLALEMGLSVETWTTKVGSSMAFNTDRSYNRFLVKLSQAYYTMSFDLPTSKEEIFHESVSPDQLARFIKPDNPATFISSVTYGRIFYMLVESTTASTEMKAKLEASYGKFGNTVEGEVDIETFNSLENTRLQVIAYGGNASGTFEIAGSSNIDQVARKLAESTDIRAGLPLSYVVRSVERPDQIVGTNISTEFDVVNCELRGILPPQGYRSLVDLFEEGFGAMVHISASNVIFFSKGGTQYAWYNGDSGRILGTFSIDDPNGPLGLTSFEQIHSAVNFSDNSLYLFDGTGLQCEIFVFDPAKYGGSSLPGGPIGTYRQQNGANRIYQVNSTFGDSGNFQFANKGFEAVCRVGATKMAYFAKPGEQFAIYNRSGNGSWENPLPNEEWFPSEGGIFEEVGAATWIYFGGQSGRWLFINDEGDQLLEWFSTPSRMSQGPWVIN